MRSTVGEAAKWTVVEKDCARKGLEKRPWVLPPQERSRATYAPQDDDSALAAE
jgi:hypothetical protein